MELIYKMSPTDQIEEKLKQAYGIDDEQIADIKSNLAQLSKIMLTEHIEQKDAPLPLTQKSEKESKNDIE